MKKSYPGISLVLTTVFVSAFLLVMAGMLESIVAAHKRSLERERMAVAEGLESGALNAASFLAAVGPTGGNTEDSNELSLANMRRLLLDMAVEWGLTEEYCEDVDGQAANGKQPCVEFVVKGRPSPTDTVTLNGVQYLSVPMRGSGTARDDC